MYFRFLVLFILTIFSRFYGFNWSGNFAFHPDENNMVNAVLQMSTENYNPHFFAYGQFPLYLGFFTQQILRLPDNFFYITFIMRIWSALFSSISVYFFYKIAQKIFKGNISFLISVLFIFTPGLIQLAHFGTTESLLILVFLINLYLSFKLFDQPLHYPTYFYASLITGIGLASKLSSLILLFPVLMVSFINLFKIKSKFKLRIVFLTVYSILFCLIFFIVFSPYNLIDKNDFLSALRYETDVATGSSPVFYTRQFVDTLPYIFQFTNVFPYVLGVPLFIISIFGIATAMVYKNKYWQLSFLSSLIYFIYFGQLYVKWTRFMSPIFFIFPLSSGYLFYKMKNKYLRTIFFILALFPGVYFMKLYFQPDIRLTASNWLAANLPQSAVVFSEGGNVIDIPISQHEFAVTNLDFYTLENNPEREDQLINLVSNADYILVPSRRIFKNFRFGYHQHLFDGSLGFTQIKQFEPSNEIFTVPENAEETWTVFDRPTIRVFQRTKHLNEDEIRQILN